MNMIASPYKPRLSNMVSTPGELCPCGRVRRDESGAGSVVVSAYRELFFLVVLLVFSLEVFRSVQMDLEAVALVALGVAVGQNPGFVFNLEEFVSLQDPHQAVDVPGLALNSDL